MNKLKGKISAIESTEAMSLIKVKVNDDVFSSLVLEGRDSQKRYHLKQEVHVLFKETEVGIAKNLSGQISLRNRFWGEIKKVEMGALLTRVTIKYGDYLLDSIISTHSAKEMKLANQDVVEWLVKTNEVTLMSLSDGA